MKPFSSSKQLEIVTTSEFCIVNVKNPMSLHFTGENIKNYDRTKKIQTLAELTS